MLKPRSVISAAVLAAAAALDVALGARLTPALAVVAPLVAFLTAALTLSALIASSGLADHAAVALARRACGNGLALYALVCGLCALLTGTVSLDGAAVLIVPLIMALHRRYRAPVAPLLLAAGPLAYAATIGLAVGALAAKAPSRPSSPPTSPAPAPRHSPPDASRPSQSQPFSPRRCCSKPRPDRPDADRLRNPAVSPIR